MLPALIQINNLTETQSDRYQGMIAPLMLTILHQLVIRMLGREFLW